MQLHTCRYYPQTLRQADYQAQGGGAHTRSMPEGSRGDSSMIAAVSKELMELDMGY